MKNTIIINGSHNRLGNTTQLLSKIYPDLEVIYLADHSIELYNYSETYSKNDEFLAIINQLLKYDTIIFATPVYWYSMSSLMKIFFDRLTDLIGSASPIGRQLIGKKVKVITSSNGNHLGDDFFLPFAATAKYLHLNYMGGKHYVNATN